MGRGGEWIPFCREEPREGGTWYLVLFHRRQQGYYKFMWQLTSQTGGALDVDIIVTMALVTVQLMMEGMKFIKKLALF